MARNKEDIQDNLLRQMDKISKRSNRNPNNETFLTTLRKQNRFDRLSDDEKRAATPYQDWVNHLENYMVNNKNICTSKNFSSIVTKYFEKITEFHETGKPFSELIDFFEEKSSILLNRF